MRHARSEAAPGSARSRSGRPGFWSGRGAGGRALPAGSPHWLSRSPAKPPGAARPSPAICSKHLAIRCRPHTGAFKLKRAVTLPPTRAGAAPPGWPSLCRRAGWGRNLAVPRPRGPPAPHPGRWTAARERLGLPQQAERAFDALCTGLGGAGRERLDPAVKGEAPVSPASST